MKGWYELASAVVGGWLALVSLVGLIKGLYAPYIWLIFLPLGIYMVFDNLRDYKKIRDAENRRPFI